MKEEEEDEKQERLDESELFMQSSLVSQLKQKLHLIEAEKETKDLNCKVLPTDSTLTVGKLLNSVIIDHYCDLRQQTIHKLPEPQLLRSNAIAIPIPATIQEEEEKIFLPITPDDNNVSTTVSQISASVHRFLFDSISQLKRYM